MPPELTKVPEIAGLEAGVGVASPINHWHTTAPLLSERSEASFLKRGDLGLAGVAQYVEMDVSGCPSLGQLAHHGVEIADHPIRPLVANKDRECGRGRDR